MYDVFLFAVNFYLDFVKLDDALYYIMHNKNTVFDYVLPLAPV